MALTRTRATKMVGSETTARRRVATGTTISLRGTVTSVIPTRSRQQQPGPPGHSGHDRRRSFRCCKQAATPAPAKSTILCGSTENSTPNKCNTTVGVYKWGNEDPKLDGKCCAVGGLHQGRRSAPPPQVRWPFDGGEREERGRALRSTRAGAVSQIQK